MHEFVRRTVLGFAVLLVVLAGARPAHADKLDFLTFTPPGAGWTAKAGKRGTMFTRGAGAAMTGVITVFASRAATLPAEKELFADWKAQMVGGGAAPPPIVTREDDFDIATAMKDLPTKQGTTHYVLVTIIHQGRVMSIAGTSGTPEVTEEVNVFLDKLVIGTPKEPAPAPTGSGYQPPWPDGAQPAPTQPAQPQPQPAPSDGKIEVTYQVPPGYVRKQDGASIVIEGNPVDDKHRCMFIVTPPRAGSGDLRADADAALANAIAGWQIRTSPEWWDQETGLGPTGWPWLLLRRDLQSTAGGRSVNAFVLMIDGGGGRVTAVYGFGPNAECTLVDPAFHVITSSVAPTTWKSDGYAQLKADLIGKWRFTSGTNTGFIDYTFFANGRFDYAGISEVRKDLGSVDKVTTTSMATDGTWKIDKGDLLLTWDVKSKGAVRKKIRIFESSTRTITTPALKLGMLEAGWVEYWRIVDQ